MTKIFGKCWLDLESIQDNWAITVKDYIRGYHSLNKVSVLIKVIAQSLQMTKLGLLLI